MNYELKIAFLLLPLLLSCEKEIPIDYRQTDQHYVAEASLTQNGINVRLYTTQNVTDNELLDHVVDNATIVLSCKYYELKDTLRYTHDGIYTSETAGNPGITYDLDIYVGDQHFSSSSTMQNEPEVKSFRFVWQKMFSERVLYGDLRIQDDPDRNNYYFMHIYRNSIGYRWAVMNDEKNKGGELQQLFSCTSESKMNDEKNKGGELQQLFGCTAESKMDNGDSDALHENDSIRIEVRAIDRASYDYLYSMKVMKSAGTNPIPNFTGGCLGYFSAYSYVNLYGTFHRNEVAEK